MNHDAVRSPVRAKAKLTSSIPFSDLPGQSRLFLDHLNDPVALKRFYPNAVSRSRDLLQYIPQMLAQYSTDRAMLCDALTETNLSLGNSEAALQNVNDLRDKSTVTVVTGQQAGLFTGPLYTIYKALSAIKLSEILRASGVSAVPVFWAATEDHDFAEVSKAVVIGREGTLGEVDYKPLTSVADVPVGNIELGPSINEAVLSMLEHLPHTEFTDELQASLRRCWSAGSGYGLAFERQIADLLGKFGLVIIDPLHPTIKKLAAPIYSGAVERSSEIVSAIRQRNDDLAAIGYHAQVLVEDDYFPLFWHTDDGRRTALRKSSSGMYKAKSEDREFSRGELSQIASEQPQRLSPGVMLRPAVQDWLLPTVCYLGGGAEIAYFAQNSGAYQILERPVTPIMHRQSFTIVESKHRRTLDKYNLDLLDLLEGADKNLEHIGEMQLSSVTGSHFDETVAIVNEKLGEIAADLQIIDPTLVAGLETRRKKINYHLESLRTKAYRAQALRDDTTERRLREALTSLVPEGQLQERVLNVSTFVNKYGTYFIDRLMAETDVEERRHKIVYF